MIVLDGVRFSYSGGPDVVRVERIELPSGLTLLLGPNGAGKSTLMRLMAGVERPRRGRILIEGADLALQEAEARRGLAYLPEQPELTPYATIEEILRLVCRLRGVAESTASAAAERAGLRDETRRSIRELSQGQRRRAVLAAAFIGEPAVLLLDEPLEAMDRAMRTEIVDWIREAAEQGRTVVVASHEFDELAPSVRYALAICRGEARLQEAPADPRKRLELFDRLARGT